MKYVKIFNLSVIFTFFIFILIVYASENNSYFDKRIIEAFEEFGTVVSYKKIKEYGDDKKHTVEFICKFKFNPDIFESNDFEKRTEAISLLDKCEKDPNFKSINDICTIKRKIEFIKIMNNWAMEIIW